METSSKGRKRRSPEPASGTPVSKKRKKSKQSSQESSQESTITFTPSSTHSSPVKKKKLKSSRRTSGDEVSSQPEQSKGGVAKAAKNKRDISEDEREHGQQQSTETQTKTRRKGKPFFLKPSNGTWMKHIGSLLVYRCVSQALMMSVDPRECAEGEVNWSVLAGGFISAKDLELIWYLIKREYPDKSLTTIREELKPYTTLTVDELTRAEIMVKFKDEFPKTPPTAYMLFVQSKSAAMKSKYPDLTQTNLAKKLGKKWQSMGAEKQEKYKQQYQQLKRERESKLEAFYTQHPDAKVPTRTKKTKLESDNLTPEEKRIKELKTFLPKTPPKAYMLFCKAKRAKVTKKHPQLSSKNITQKLSRKWKEMTASEKAKYQEVYDESMKQYREQLKLFHETYPDAKELLSKSKKSQAAEISTQTSLLATPGKHTAMGQDEDTDYSSDENKHIEVKGQVRGARQSSSDESDTEVESDSTPPPTGPSKGTSSVTTKSHDQSHDTDTSSDDPSSESGSD